MMSFRIGGLYYRSSSTKATVLPKISKCFPFRAEPVFCKNKEEAIDALKLCVAYEDKIIEEIESAFKNSK